MKVTVKQALKKLMSEDQISIARSIFRVLRGTLVVPLLNGVGRYLLTPINKRKNSNKKNRYLELGPGSSRIKGFETFNVVWSSNVDYVGDASKKLPFKSESFDLVYASHCLEHIAWYQVPDTLKEWVRILKRGGCIELWVPNGLEIARAFVDAEDEKENRVYLDGWYKFNASRDPCVWANGRLFSYGDGRGTKTDPNWHMSMFSARYLKQLMESCGLKNIELLDRSEVRGHDHGWINLGFRGIKK